MKEYISRADHNLIAMICAFSTYLEQELQNPKTPLRTMSRKVNCIITYSQHIIDALLDGKNPEQINHLSEQISRQRLCLTYKEDPRLKQEWIMVRRSTFEQLVHESFSACFMCELTGKEERDCPRRHLLLAASATPTEEPKKKGACPFKHGM